MKLKTKQFKIISLFCILMVFSMIVLPVKSRAISTNELLLVEDIDSTSYALNQGQTRSVTYGDVTGKEFFIKNMYTGQYLDVSGGVAKNGTNVQQYKFNGTDSQRWYIKNNGDSISIYTRLGNDGTYKYALDIDNGSGENYANVQIWQINNTDAQKFSITQTGLASFYFKTKASNYSKAIVLNGPTCDQGRNVDQYTYQAHANEMWILEPVSKNPTLGIEYANKNWNQYVPAYPNCSNLGGDCANFASQCMLAGGNHYTGNWKVYRKNNNYSAPSDTTQLDNSWELCAPNTSPWISASEFGNFWKENAGYYAAKGSYIIEHPDEIWNLNIGTGDVIQKAGSTILGGLGKSKHTMYITSYGSYNNNNSYVVTYHSTNTSAVNLLQLCAADPNSYYVFFQMR